LVRIPGTHEPFQELFVADLFAGYRECWLVVPEGNGKTTVIALLALYHIRFRSEAWVPVAASTRDQAGIIYRQASGFVRRNQLEHEFHCHPGLRRIRCDATFGSIQIFAAEASGGDGVIPTLAIIDEPHPNEFLYIEGDDDRSPEDMSRMVGALRELIDELERRGRQRLL